MRLVELNWEDMLMENSLNRRQILSGAVALSLAGQFSSGASAQSAKLRQSVSSASLRPQTLVSYKKAVTAMLALPPQDPRNWYRQAIIHVLDCPHGNWWFMPWHRGYLANFESICRELSGDADFALPYWDWSATPKIPPSLFEDVLSPSDSSFLENSAAFDAGFTTSLMAFFNSVTPLQREWLNRRGFPDVDTLMSEIGGSLVDRQFARHLTAVSPDLPAFAQQAVAESYVRLCIKPDSAGEYSFTEFASELTNDHYVGGTHSPIESGPHDNVHGGIDGLMGAFMSPVDPIFWMHHCNIDRIWDVWSRRQVRLGLRGFPDEAAWGAEPFPFFVDKAGNPLPSSKAADYSDINSLAYSYEAGTGEDLAQPALPFVALSGSEFSPLMASVQSLRTLREVNTATRIPNDLLVAARTDANDRSPETTNQALNLLAQVTLKPPSEAESYRVNVFANCPYLSPFTPVEDPHFVGAISFFGVAHHGKMRHDKELEVTYTLPLANTIKRLAAKSTPIRNQIKLQFMTIGETGGVVELDGSLLKTVIKTT